MGYKYRQQRLCLRHHHQLRAAKSEAAHQVELEDRSDV